MTNGVSRMSDGGQAFPMASGGGEFGLRPVAGMTLRDYFAGQALAGMVNIIDWYNLPDTRIRVIDHCTGAAYKIADSMLAARNESQE